MKIVTGYAGEAHITSNDDQGLLQGIFGSGSYILPVRGRFAATLVSSNELQISDGEGVLQGVHFRTEPGTTDSVTIENGTQGMQRIDLICARYQKDAETGIETMSWINHKGTPAASNPATPSITSGDLLAGDTLAEFPVYAVRLNGITVQSVTQLATILSPQALIGDSSISGIGDGTITGALSALNASLRQLIITREVQSNSVTIAANAIGAASINCAYDGYALLGVIGISTSQTEVLAIHRFFMNSSGTVTVTLRNTYSDSKTTVVTVRCIYRKN